MTECCPVFAVLLLIATTLGIADFEAIGGPETNARGIRKCVMQLVLPDGGLQGTDHSLATTVRLNSRKGAPLKGHGSNGDGEHMLANTA